MRSVNRREIGMMLLKYGDDILHSGGMEREKEYMQHGAVSVYHHSVSVAYVSLYLARRFDIQVDEKALVREHCSMTISSMTGMFRILRIDCTAFSMQSGR